MTCATIRLTALVFAAIMKGRILFAIRPMPTGSQLQLGIPHQRKECYSLPMLTGVLRFHTISRFDDCRRVSILHAR
jgi:hypothetical protein